MSEQIKTVQNIKSWSLILDKKNQRRSCRRKSCPRTQFSKRIQKDNGKIQQRKTRTLRIKQKMDIQIRQYGLLLLTQNIITQ